MQTQGIDVNTTTIEQQVRSIIASKLQIDMQGISNEMSLSDIGFDSLSLSDLAETIDDQFDVSSPNRMIPGTLSIRVLIHLIETAHQGRRDKAQRLFVAEGAD